MNQLNQLDALLTDPEDVETQQRMLDVLPPTVSVVEEAGLSGQPCSICTADFGDDDVLKVLLPEEEAAWLGDTRSRPIQLIGMMRRTLQAEFQAGRLPRQVHYKLEDDVRDLGLVVGGCERLFSSPVPPTMSRHVVRCLR